MTAIPKDKLANLNQGRVMLKEPLGPIPMVAAGSTRDWPANRGMHIADSGKFYIWVNEEDHLKIIS